MKTFRLIEATLFAILLCSSACSSGSDDPIEPTPKPEVIKSEITIDSSIISNGLSFSNAGGDKSISFSTNENWTLSVANTTSGATWCTASATNGTKGSASVKFAVTENTDYENRSVSVTIKSGTANKTFTITQKSADALLITTDKYEVGQEGGTIEIEVKANIDYKMEISETAKDWIKDSSSRSLTTDRHKLEISMNETFDKREGEITFKSGDKVETVKVYQAGGAIILLSQDEYTVSDAGETISVEIKSNVEFGIQMPDVEWITDEASSRGMSSHTLKYIVAANEGYDNRSAEIIFYDKNSNLKDTLVVNQAQKDAIVASEKNISVAKEGGIVEVNVASNVDYEVQIPSEATWITQTDSRALVEKNVYLKVAENTGEENRSAEITLKNKSLGLSEKVIITQECPTSEGYVNGVLTIKTTGTLKKLLGNDYLNIKSLKVVGPINGDDIYYLRKMSDIYNDCGKLTTLDLSQASIVKGGENYYTSDNIIGEGMFAGSKLQQIELPQNTVLIDDYAFFECSLTSIVIPEGVTSIGIFAFGHSSLLSKVVIPNTVVKIGSSAFIDCPLTSLVIPNSVEVIDDYAFANCDGFTNITIGNGVKSIGNEAFCGCDALKFIVIPDNVVKLGYGTFAYCSNLYKAEIGDGITLISNSTFQDCTNLAVVKIGENVKEIGAVAFMNARICEFYSYATTPPILSNSSQYPSFKNGIENSKRTKLFVPVGCATKYKGWGGFVNIIEME